MTRGNRPEDQTRQRSDEHVRERFVSTLAHDLANPLTAIRGTVQVLKRRIWAGTASEEMLISRLDNIDSACTRVIARLDELVELALLRDGQLPEIERQPVDLVDLARQMAVHHQAGTERHTIQLDPQEQSLVGNWDRARLIRLIDNLLTNAIKYSPRGGTITIRVSRDSSQPERDMAVLSVSDQGIGIPEAEIPRLFERYHRARNVQDIPGTGVGLFAVQQIVEQHGGTVQVESTPGKGSTFTVRLPLS